MRNNAAYPHTIYEVPIVIVNDFGRGSVCESHDIIMQSEILTEGGWYKERLSCLKFEHSDFQLNLYISVTIRT
jgi:hypothetical protein